MHRCKVTYWLATPSGRRSFREAEYVEAETEDAAATRARERLDHDWRAMRYRCTGEPTVERLGDAWTARERDLLEQARLARSQARGAFERAERAGREADYQRRRFERERKVSLAEANVLERIAEDCDTETRDRLANVITVLRGYHVPVPHRSSP